MNLAFSGCATLALALAALTIFPEKYVLREFVVAGQPQTVLSTVLVFLSWRSVLVYPTDWDRYASPRTPQF